VTPALATVFDTLTDPFAQGLMQRALLEVLLLAAVGGTLGCWIVLTELSYGAESLAHGMFPGLVLAALAGIPLLLGGAAGILIAALAIVLAGRGVGGDRIGRDNATAVAVTTLFGLGALLALAPDTPVGVQALLFGDVLGTTTGDLLAGAALVAVVLAVLRLVHWRLLAAGFDRASARSVGASPAVADVVLLVLLALAVLVAVQGLGNLLVVAVLVAPAAGARLLTRRLGPMMALAVALGAVAGIAGLYLSYYARVAAGASIAGLLVCAYVLAWLAASVASRRAPSPARNG
jgi:ABC-type Mn2+/Zn2+ transport system permease subunit